VGQHKKTGINFGVALVEAVCANWRLSHSSLVCTVQQMNGVCLSVTASHLVPLQINSWSFSCTSSRHEYYYGPNGPPAPTLFRFVYSIRFGGGGRARLNVP
jgi:hypothetical protein